MTDSREDDKSPASDDEPPEATTTSMKCVVQRLGGLCRGDHPPGHGRAITARTGGPEANRRVSGCPGHNLRAPSLP